MGDFWDNVRVGAEVAGIVATSPFSGAGDITPAYSPAPGPESSFVVMADNANDALVESATGRMEGEDAATTEPVPEAESSEHRDPPPGASALGWENVDTAEFDPDLTGLGDSNDLDGVDGGIGLA